MNNEGFTVSSEVQESPRDSKPRSGQEALPVMYKNTLDIKDRIFKLAQEIEEIQEGKEHIAYTLAAYPDLTEDQLSESVVGVAHGSVEDRKKEIESLQKVLHEKEKHFSIKKMFGSLFGN